MLLRRTLDTAKVRIVLSEPAGEPLMWLYRTMIPGMYFSMNRVLGHYGVVCIKIAKHSHGFLGNTL
jgi:hypothetical protein